MKSPVIVATGRDYGPEAKRLSSLGAAQQRDILGRGWAALISHAEFLAWGVET